MINEYRGGAEGNRTPDLCSAIAALSHLSYGPKARAFRIWPEVLSRKPLTCEPSGVRNAMFRSRQIASSAGRRRKGYVFH
jgi:hypothetical protein